MVNREKKPDRDPGAIHPSSMSDSIDLVCLSHLRWDFVYQRPQHLLSRFGRERRVFFIEEPVFGESSARLDVSRRGDRIYVVVPHLPRARGREAVDAAVRQMVEGLFAEHKIEDHILWYYTPMALPWMPDSAPLAVIYDCMDELSAFKGAPDGLGALEARLFEQADLVFTGGMSLYEAKRLQHPHVHAFPSSIDVDHFAQARNPTADPPDQADMPHPRLGYFGVIDERMDIDLLEGAATLRPDWHWVMVGPVVKIDPAILPRRPNLHFLGGKPYAELPSYIAGWDVAIMPFARNESTRFISPTKTPEYLAAGRPVVSTSIHDVIHPYGQRGLVHIADTPLEFVLAAEAAMREDTAARCARVDPFLAQTSWERTWQDMKQLIDEAVRIRRASLSAVRRGEIILSGR